MNHNAIAWVLVAVRHENENMYRWADILILSLSAYVSIYLGFVTFTGLIWTLTLAEVIATSIPLLIAAILASSSIILTHSLIHFFQTRQIRNLVILLMALDIIILGMTYLVSHPIFSGWLPFADRNRNRTLMIAMGLAIFPSMLAGSFLGEATVNRQSGLLSILWGMIVIPLMGLWFLFSPSPVFFVTSPSGGLAGLSPLALLMVLIIAITMLSSLIKYAYDWYRRRDRVVMVSCLALGFWLYGEIIIVLLENPLQLAEVIWLGAFTTGFVVIALGMSVSAVFEPRKILEETVANRTKELEDSKAESEFYLGMWTHKMGNILQAMIVYLDLLGEHKTEDAELQDVQISAKVLSREATLLNLQVTKLSQILDSRLDEIQPFPLASILSNAMDHAAFLLNPQDFKVHLEISENPRLYANDMLAIAILSIISFVIKTRNTDDLSFLLQCELNQNDAILFIKCPGTELTEEVQEYLSLESVMLTTRIDFDIFVARSIINIFKGRLSYRHNLHEGMNIFEITIPRVPDM